MIKYGFGPACSGIFLKSFLVLIALACCLAVPLPGFQSPAYAHAQSSTHTTGVTTAHYNKGWFKKKRSGHWGEYNRNGKLRYSFREVCRGMSSVFLRNDKLGVDIEIDAHNRVIYAQWPGMPRHEMHRITKLKGAGPTIGLRSAPPYARCPFGHSGISIKGPGVVLYPPSTPVQPPVHPPVKPPAPPPVYPPHEPPVHSPHPPVDPEFPLLPGTMPIADKIKCIAEGGFVERAGMAGFERCTKRFSDGGKICTDSSECEGKCFSNTATANQSNVTGNCQKTDNPFGCRAEVSNGKTGFALCVD